MKFPNELQNSSCKIRESHTYGQLLGHYGGRQVEAEKDVKAFHF